MSSQNRNGSFFYTLLGYVMILLIIALITFLIGVSLYWSGFYRVLISVSADTFAKWSGLAIFTPLTFGG